MAKPPIKKNLNLNVSEKAEQPLAKNLSELIGKDVKNIAEHLGCSSQAINQYKQGTSVPQLNKLIKIAEYFNVTTDYLLGLSKVKTTDPKIKEICEYTGLSDEAVEFLHNHRDDNEINVLNNLVGTINFWKLLKGIGEYRSMVKNAFCNEEWMSEGNFNRFNDIAITPQAQEAQFKLFQMQQLINLIAEDGANNG